MLLFTFETGRRDVDRGVPRPRMARNYNQGCLYIARRENGGRGAGTC